MPRISMTDVVKNKRNDLNRFEPARDFIKAQIVSINGSVEVAGREGYCWVQEWGNQGSVFQARNTKVAKVAGLAVLVGRGTKAPFEREVLETDPAMIDQPTYTGQAFINPHANLHQWPAGNPGPDPVLVYTPAIQMFKTTSAETDYTVDVSRLDAYLLDGYIYTFAGGSVDLSSKIPDVGKNRYVLIYLNRITGLLDTETGMETNEIIEPPKPAIPAGVIPSAFVKIGGNNLVILSDNITDARFFLHENPEPKHNPYATTYPNTGDDVGDGYSIGSIWENDGLTYECIDATAGGAAWRPVSIPADDYGLYKTIPGLRGLWLFGQVGDAGAGIDESGQGRTLTYNGTPTYNRYLISGAESHLTYVDFNGTTDYFSRADEAGLDILGTEAYIGTTKGLSMGVWVWFDDTGTIRNTMGKLGAAGQRSFYIQRTAANLMAFGVSSNGTALTTINTAGTVSSGKWYYVGASYTPSTSLNLWITDYSTAGNPLVLAQNTTAIPAAIFNSTASFTLAVIATLANYHDGRLAKAFLAASALPASWHEALYNASRWQFGV